MPSYKCPKNHESTESDFCSVCGAKIQGSPEVTTAVQKTATLTCPDCSAPHDPHSGNFCEICGYNFTSGAHGDLPPANITPTPLLKQEELTSSIGEKTHLTWAVVATVDPSLYEEGSPQPPTNQAPIIFHLEKENNLIGRSSSRRGIYPEVDLDFDDAVSHRHALLSCQPDGTLIVRDIGSTNGTKLNGVELTAMIDAPIKEGDELTLGHWTRMTVVAANS